MPRSGARTLGAALLIDLDFEARVAGAAILGHLHLDQRHGYVDFAAIDLAGQAIVWGVGLPVRPLLTRVSAFCRCSPMIAPSQRSGDRPMKVWKNSLAAGLLAVFAAGCATSGMGMGRSLAGTRAALFTWKQERPRGGLMAASLDTGQIYVGQFFRITSETRVEELEPLWLGWRHSSEGWDHWGPDAGFIAHHAGAVVANLNGPDGQMRCRLQLPRPNAGMAGGGGGRCQLPDGTTMGATFPPVGWPG